MSFDLDNTPTPDDGREPVNLSNVSAPAELGAVFNAEDLAGTLEQIRHVISTACLALEAQDIGDGNQIRMVLMRHADDALIDVIDQLQVRTKEAEVDHGC